MNQSQEYQLGYYYLVGGRPALSPIQLASYTDDFRRGYRDRELLRYSIEAYGFIIPWNITYTAIEFADAIKNYTTHPEAKIIASVVEHSNLTFEHNRKGIRAYSEEEV